MEEASIDALAQLVQELDGARDDEHPDVSISDDESGWSVSVFQSGLVVLENVEDELEEPRHMVDIPRSSATDILRLVANESWSELESLPWRSGYADS